MNCKEALPLIHDYLDGELAKEQTGQLERHLAECAACAGLLRAFERTEAWIRSTDRTDVPAGLSAKVMLSLPPASGNRSLLRWMRRHPAAAAAAAFFVIMVSSFLSLWNQGTQLAVRGDDLEGIVIEGNKVIVPPEATVEGDLVVENGTVQVDGDLRGNLIVIDGTVALASTAHISGSITEVDRALDWIWFKVKEWIGAMLPEPNT